MTLFLIISYSYFFIIFLNPNSSFFSINKPLPLHFFSSSLLSLLCLLGFGYLESKSASCRFALEVWLVCLFGWSLDCAIQKLDLFSSRCELSIFFLCVVGSSSLLLHFSSFSSKSSDILLWSWFFHSLTLAFLLAPLPTLTLSFCPSFSSP